MSDAIVDSVAVEQNEIKIRHRTTGEDILILYDETIGILRMLRAYIENDMSGFYAMYICYDITELANIRITVFGGTSVELYYRGHGMTFSVAELLDIVRFAVDKLGKS
jgi:hypothetical protein